MSWIVNVVENNLVTSEETANNLMAYLNDQDYYMSSYMVGSRSMLELDFDAMEFIDFIANYPKSVDILNADPETRGKICFADFEGDGNGNMWGYSFEDGKMVKLKGRIEWDEVTT